MANSELEFSYTKLWKLLIDKKMIKKDLMNEASLTTTTIAKLGKGKPVSMETLARICDILDCNVGDIVDYTPKKRHKKGLLKK